MKTTYIVVPDLNDSFSDIVLDGAEYLIRFTYNDTYDFWTVGLYYPDRTPIVQGLKVVPDFPINVFSDRTYMPRVVLACTSIREQVGRNSFVNGEASFAIVEADDDA